MGLLSPHAQEQQVYLVCERRGEMHHEHDPDYRFTTREDAQAYADSMNAAVRVPGYFYVVAGYGDE